MSASTDFPPLKPFQRPFLTLKGERWFITDKTCGYHREITLEQLRHLLGDGLEGLGLSLRVEGGKTEGRCIRTALRGHPRYGR